MQKKVIILRGLPGSGKTSAAKKMASQCVAGGGTVVTCSADDFFLDALGDYKFDPTLLGRAHAECMHKFLKSLDAGIDLVIVDNTNTEIWEYQNYARATYLTRGEYILEITTILEGAQSVPELSISQIHELARRCTHGVSAQQIAAMALRWQT